MTSPWTEPEGRKGLTRGQWIGLGAVFVIALGFAAYGWFSPKGTPLDANVILGEWQAKEPPWHLSFRPDKTVEMTYDGSGGPETLRPTVMTPGVPVAGKFVRSEKGVYRFKLDNGKYYEGAIGKYKIRKDDKLVDVYAKNRLDVTDAEGSSAVLVFERVAGPSAPQGDTPSDERSTPSETR